MYDSTDNNRDLLREAIEHVKRCASWTQLTEAQQKDLVIEYIRKRVASRPHVVGREVR